MFLKINLNGGMSRKAWIWDTPTLSPQSRPDTRVLTLDLLPPAHISALYSSPNIDLHISNLKSNSIWYLVFWKLKEDGLNQNGSNHHLSHLLSTII